MSSSIENTLNELDALLDKSWALLGNHSIVDEDKIRELLETIRINMPDEISQARAVVRERNQILNDAKKDAEGFIKKAEEKAKVILNEDNLVRQAQARALGLLNEATTKATEIVNKAQEDADDIINKANQKASETLAQANQHSREMKQASYDFAENVLRTSQEVLAKSLDSITSTRNTLNQALVDGNLNND